MERQVSLHIIESPTISPSTVPAALDTDKSSSQMPTPQITNYVPETPIKIMKILMLFHAELQIIFTTVAISIIIPGNSIKLESDQLALTGQWVYSITGAGLEGEGVMRPCKGRYFISIYWDVTSAVTGQQARLPQSAACGTDNPTVPIGVTYTGSNPGITH